MAENKEYVAKSDNDGSVTISEEVVASIAGIAAMEIDGIAALGVANVTDFLSKKSPTKGVKITFGETSGAVNMTVTVMKGAVIPSVAASVQSNVITSIESMTGIKVEYVNVKVAGVMFEKEKKKPAEKTEE